jgi:hypothetical protein
MAEILCTPLPPKTPDKPAWWPKGISFAWRGPEAYSGKRSYPRISDERFGEDPVQAMLSTPVWRGALVRPLRRDSKWFCKHCKAEHERIEVIQFELALGKARALVFAYPGITGQDRLEAEREAWCKNSARSMQAFTTSDRELPEFEPLPEVASPSSLAPEVQPQIEVQASGGQAEEPVTPGLYYVLPSGEVSPRRAA